MRFAWLPGLLFCFCCLVSTSLYAINATVAWSVFYHLNNTTVPLPYAMVYWQIDPTGLHYFSGPDSTLIAHIRTDIVLRNDTGIIHEDHYNLDTKPLKHKLVMHQTILDAYRHALPPGKVTVQIKLSEEGFNEPFLYNDSFTVDAATEQPFYSSIQLIDTVFAAGQPGNIFDRDGTVQLPMTMNFLDEYKNQLRYYFEVYQANKVSKQQLPLTQTVYISKRKNEGVIYSLRHSDTALDNKQLLSFSGTLPLAVLPSGNYYLNAVLKDALGTTIATQSSFFQRINTNPTAPPTAQERDPTDTGAQQINVVDLSKTFLAKYTTAQIKAILKMLLPNTDVAERDAIRSFQKTPDDTYMRYFVLNYFTRRDPKDPKGAWEKYTEKVREVNKLFQTAGKGGYETDRGFIYLKYGPPSERIYARNEQGSLPYEIWVYNSLPKYNRMSYFLFYQPSETSMDYELLHTTVPDEVRNYNWRKLLFPSGQNPSSRAEQYIGNN